MTIPGDGTTGASKREKSTLYRSEEISRPMWANASKSIVNSAATRLFTSEKQMICYGGNVYKPGVFQQEEKTVISQLLERPSIELEKDMPSSFEEFPKIVSSVCLNINNVNNLQLETQDANGYFYCPWATRFSLGANCTKETRIYYCPLWGWQLTYFWLFCVAVPKFFGGWLQGYIL